MNTLKSIRQGDHYSLTNYSGSLVNKKKIVKKNLTKATEI